MNSGKTVKYLLLGAAILTAMLLWVVSDAFVEHVVAAGDSAPGFTVITESGRRITPTDFGGKVLVLNFWATWCPPCVEEGPSLVEMSKQLGPQGVVVLGVSVDKNEGSYRAFLRKMNIGFETSRDPSWRISAEYGTFKIPETYVITPDGKVVEKFIGPVDFMSADTLSTIRKFL